MITKRISPRKISEEPLESRMLKMTEATWQNIDLAAKIEGISAQTIIRRKFDPTIEIVPKENLERFNNLWKEITQVLQKNKAPVFIRKSK